MRAPSAYRAKADDLMIAIDTNILVYASVASSPNHAAALCALEGLALSGSAWGVPYPCAHEFLTITTNQRIYTDHLSASEAFEVLEVMNKNRNFRWIGLGPLHLDTLKTLLLSSGVSGGAIHDARIAACCIDAGAHELWSADRDFSSFPGLRVRNPLVAKRD